MAKEFFKNLPDTSTPLTATRLNGLLDGDESQGNLVVESIKSKNMFDKNNVVKGYLYTSTGDIYADSDRFISIPYIKVEPNADYTFSATNVDIFRFIEYDSSKNFIQRQIAPTEVNSKTYTTSATTEYVRISCNISNLSSLQLEKGSAATTYSSYNAYGSSNLKDENIVVGSIRSKNIINTNAFLGMNGGSGSFEQLKTGARIITGNTGANQWANFLLPNDLLGKKCTFSLKASASSSNVPMARIFYGSPTNMTNTTANFDLYGTGLKSKTETFLSALPSGCTNIYMILYANRDGSGFSAGAYSDFENLQLEIGEEQTSYSSYQDLENQEIYSTGEVKIGTWIDGKPFYRRVFTITSLTSSNTNLVDVSGLSIDFAKISGTIITSIGAKFPINLYDSAANYSVIFLSDAGYIRGRGAIGSGTLTKCMVILEYTKTTD